MDKLTEANLEVYKRGRTALTNLRKDRNYQWWVDYGNAALAAQAEAMHRAGVNSPHGAKYRQEINAILEREKLVAYETRPDKTRKPFPDPNTRKDAILMVESLHHAKDPRRDGIETWRGKLSLNDRARLNHPSNILRRWTNDTEPQVEKDAKALAREAKPLKENPHLQALADTEGERDDARRHAEGLRDLLGQVLAAWDDMPETMREAIQRALAG